MEEDTSPFRYRLRFSKNGKLIYIGHLDLLKVFRQTMRRAGLPAAYSQGYNPHMLLALALPLPLGMESVNDYADIALIKQVEINELINTFNGSAPSGLTITGAKKLTVKTDGKIERIAALPAAADYAVYFRDIVLNCLEMKKIIEALLNEDVLIIPKKTKSGIKNTDIRGDIYTIRCEPNPEPRIFLKLAAGSERFLNPQTVIHLIRERTGSLPFPFFIRRLELYGNDQELIF